MAGRSSVDDRGLRPPPAHTQDQRPATAPQPGSPAQEPRKGGLSHTFTSPDGKAPENDDPNYQRLVLSDPVAFRYLSEDPLTTVIERRSELEGFEAYVVEQWATSRTHPTFVITTYTGDPAHVVVVGVLSVPVDESTWSPRLRVYFKALNQYHARRRETALGILMVTNLSGFPSSLTVIPVPNGDMRKHRFDFFVNENLKRMGCSGRVGLTLTAPSGATTAKFHQLYRTSEKNELYKSIIELVKLCQSALMLFDELEIDYADGLLCDVTEKAINDWWVEIGTDHYNIEPHDGILGPTTVAGLLGLLMGTRNRLHAVGAPVSKEPFDVEAMKRAIGAFQKQQRLTRSRRLDRKTLDRLHKLTTKAANSEGWTMPRAVKSTVAELSGKGGEMVMDVVGRRDRAGIAEIETCDMERFAQLVFGERCKWLWYSKPVKKTKQPEPLDSLPTEAGLVFKPDENGGFTWTGRKSTVDGAPAGKREQYDDLASPGGHDDSDEDEAKMRSLFNRATGIDKLRGAVGLRGHGHKESKDSTDSPNSPVEDGRSKRRPHLRRSSTDPVKSPATPSSQTGSRFDDTIFNQRQSPQQKQSPTSVSFDHRQSINTHMGAITETPDKSLEDIPQEGESLKDSEAAVEDADDADQKTHKDEDDQDADDTCNTATNTTGTAPPSIAGSTYKGIDLNDTLPTGPETEIETSKLLRRTLSTSRLISTQHEPPRSPSFHPRHLSFSLAEQSVLTWDPLTPAPPTPPSQTTNPLSTLAETNHRTLHLKTLHSHLLALETRTATYTASQITTLQETLLPLLSDHHQTLTALYYPHLNRLQCLQESSSTLMHEERERLEEAGKELETLVAKLEYEIEGLRGRVEEVENGVAEFGKGVARVEERVRELEGLEGKSGWGCSVM
ncbi:hypothetical protein MBLNU230_g5448t1 [Neophaeotheca triangularis]